VAAFETLAKGHLATPPAIRTLPGMNDLADVLELLYGAEGSFRTVRASIRIWRDEEKHQLAFERHFEEEQERGGGGSMMVVVGEPDEEAPTQTEELIRIWLEKPARRREEVEGRGRVCR
jgi:hypothetical protein